MRHFAWALALASFGSACGSSESSTPPTDPAPEQAAPERAVSEGTAPERTVSERTVSERTVPQQAAPASSPSEPSTARAPTRPVRPPAATVRAHRAELAAARELVRRGELEQAVRAFDALIEHTAGSPRILCEAGYVAHRAGDDDEARALLERGIERFEAMDDTREDVARSFAMCLYNSGLVHEAAREPAEAALDYDWSLELRPNPTVQRRFDALPAEARREAESQRRPSERPGPGDDGAWEAVSDLQTAVEMTERVWCGDTDMSEGCRASAGELVEGEGRSFQLVHVGGSCCGGMSSTWTTQLFVVEGGRHRHVAEIVSVMDMGGFDSVGHELRDVRARQLVPGGPSELSFELWVGVDDTEDGYCESRTTSHGFCLDHRGELTCRVYTVEDTQVCYESAEDFGEGEEQLDELSREERSSIRFLEDGRVRIEGELCVPAGEYTVDELFARDCGRP